MELLKTSRFDRVASNEAKMGFYPTDPGHCRRISYLLDFTKADEICAVDLCAGKGDALCQVTGKKEGDNLHLFTVELNHERANDCKSNPQIEYAIEADALEGSRLSHKAFSFAMANPPYGVDSEGRLELKFLDRYAEVVAAGGVLALVIPYKSLNSDVCVRKLLTKWEVVYVARFDDDEYAKYKQVFVLAYRKKERKEGYAAGSVEKFLANLTDITKLQYLPTAPLEKRLVIPRSRAEKVEFFTTKNFDSAIAINVLKGDVTLGKIFNDFATVPQYTGIKVGRPPVPSNRTHKYLMAVAGVGQGIVGNEENGDMHLQRGGVVQKKCVQRVVKDNSTHELETTSAVSSMVLISQVDDAKGRHCVIKELIGETSSVPEEDED